ncbi:MAG: caspase family protein [Fimbriimonadaceae bacterium]|nr:caspase family protein [Chitinophagales bacterium]
MIGFDSNNTKVLLIGTSKFPNDVSIKDIPNVEVNIELLKKVLTNSELVGIPIENISVSLNEDNKQIQKKLLELAKATKTKDSTLLVYYSGHGIMSTSDYELYLTTIDTTTELLEIEGINIENFKKYIRQSYAGRKILILDCCHSGHIIGSMGDMSSKIQSEIKGFEGTYVMTSAAEDAPSLFPQDQPELPTNFTGKLVEIIEQGVGDTEEEYSSLRDIFRAIETDFIQKGLPRPQQSNFNTADQLFFAKNRKFLSKKPEDEIAWIKAAKQENKMILLDFIDDFPNSKYVVDATILIARFEEDELWNEAQMKNTISGYINFKFKFTESRYLEEANSKIQELKGKEKNKSKPTEKKKIEEDHIEEEEMEEEEMKEVIYEKTVNETDNTKTFDVKEDEIYAELDKILLIDDTEEQDIEFGILEKKYRDHKIILLYKAVMYGQKNLIKRAQTAFSEVLKLYPQYADAHNVYGRFLAYNIKDMHAAQLAFEESIVLDPASIDNLTQYGIFLRDEVAQIDKAEKIFKDIIKLNPANAEAHFHIAVIYRTKKEFEKAEKHFITSLKFNPEADYCENAIGLLYIDHMNDPEKAAPHFLKASQLDPKQGTYFYNCAVAALDLGKPQEANSFYKKAKTAEIKHIDEEFEKTIKQELKDFKTNTPSEYPEANRSVNPIIKSESYESTEDDNTRIIAKFAGINCIKYKDRNSVVSLSGAISEAELLVRENSLELKTVIMSLKMTGIISIEYLDAAEHSSQTYNFIKINFSRFEKKPLIWDNSLTVLLYKFSFWGGAPTKELYNELVSLVKKKKLKVG